MGKSQHNERGFTLIAALLFMVLLSALAIGIMYLVTNEGHASGNDQENTLAYYGAESGIEKLTADLGALYSKSLAPQNSQIQALTGSYPTGLGVGYPTYQINYQTDINGNPVTQWHPVSAGSNQGLFAEIVPMTLTVNAVRPTGASVYMTRNVEIALIPVFQFGVFCGYDCSYFPGPNFSFGGRVHTNGNLFLGDGANLVFNDKIAAFGEIIMDQLENGHATSSGYTGTVYVSTSAGGCPLNSFPPSSYGPGTNCVPLPQSTPSSPGDASWSGGYPPSGSTNPNFPNISISNSTKTPPPPLGLKGYVVNHTTGATNMQLPFVQNSCTSNPPPCTDPIQIIRKAPAGESTLSSLSQSRLYTKAQIRVLIADTEADLRPGQPLGDPDDIQFASNAGVPNSINITTAGIAYNSTNGGTGFVSKSAVTGTQYFGVVDSSQDTNWQAAGAKPFTPINPKTGVPYVNWQKWPLLGEITTLPADTSTGGYSGQGAWIRVEYENSAGKFIGVTREWLGWGFGRNYGSAPILPGPTGLTTPKAGQNQVNPHAIVILQQLRPAAAVTSPLTGNNVWYPINFYDPREGNPRDVNNGVCAVNGVMNAVEIDVGNVAQWLAGQGVYAGGSGKLVNYADQNGWVMYFSDRRGMLPNPNQGNVTSGESGLEDVVNSGVSGGTPDGKLESKDYYTYSAEDVDQNGLLDNWGGANIGYGFRQNTNSVPPNPYLGTACTTTALANVVTGARHILKLVDGGMDGTGKSYLPMRWDTPTPSGGFTLASENPVYVQGNYNTGPTDPFWTSNFTNSGTPHAAASIIADSVTVLSNQWTEMTSLNYPTNTSSRVPAPISGQDAYYRMAVAGGKNIPFPQPSWGSQDMGTDGGLHNFLRYNENLNKITVHYNGSLVSMYYSEYNTGIFKCCTTVYGAPGRDYHFDVLFLNPANLPPGTPMFQDIVNLSYTQNFQSQ